MQGNCRKIVFATNNLHKLNEVQHILGNHFLLLSLSDLEFYHDIPEDHETLEENASQKARFIYNRFMVDCFADDTGLEVDALSGKPGVYSARYAGDQKSTHDNVKKLLVDLNGQIARGAQFRTVISLIINGKEKQFEGIIRGRIIDELRGEKGFGYDPVFVPEGYSKTFAELDLSIKNQISHRAIAIQKLVSYLKSI
ncbi:MAG: non-canonical purine NTP diphosphatase [Bacteroidales bacterium]|mgnify:CR=1 FL=1|jgi:XTP/dITP diphosphohydrolase|nr:non-canonical purine NTP diphosphatase [Bacteroidales bacterium]MDY0198122.1 non-canonical purine NTP diphosphatase [Tenuifilaceae bacterium]